MVLDYDLRACLEYNPQEGYFTADDIAGVLAVWEGENEGDGWRWILRLTDGRFAFLHGWCDYTGWDCQSWAECAVLPNPEQALPLALTDELYRRYYGYEKAELRQDVHDSLARQLKSGRDTTWRENKDDEFGHPSFVDKD